MPNNISESKKVTTESEIGSNGVGHSTVLSNKSGEAVASPEELQLALVASQKTITKLTQELEAMKSELAANNKSDDSVNRLADLLATAITANSPVKGPKEPDNLNKATDFKERMQIDGTSLMEAQATMMMYKNEPKEMISIPKTFQSQFGPALVVTVNGVRVAIPVDGKSYAINKTHAQHAKERMAKVDRLLADTEPQIIETNA
jgi:hypothetical protein